MSKLLRFSPLVALLMLGACTTIPTGPSVMAMPGTGKSFDQFRGDDADCRQFALDQIGGLTANQTAVESGMASAAVGTVVGALAGAAIGGHQGAGVGAGVGLLAGSAAGAGAGQASGYSLQQRYDNAYVQCMYAKGDRVPVSGRMMSGPERAGYPPPPPARSYAPSPPPSGYPPPPPPGRGALSALDR
jgi:OmpA family protein